MGCSGVYVRNAALVAPGRRPRTQPEAPRRTDRLLDRKFCALHRRVTSVEVLRLPVPSHLPGKYPTVLPKLSVRSRKRRYGGGGEREKVREKRLRGTVLSRKMPVYCCKSLVGTISKRIAGATRVAAALVASGRRPRLNSRLLQLRWPPNTFGRNCDFHDRCCSLM